MPSDRHPRETLPRSARIRSKRVFDELFQARRCVRDRWITLYAGRNNTGLARIGIAVGRRHGGAVQRNRIKRLIREAFRRNRHALPQGLDWIVRLHPGAEPTVVELGHSLIELAKRLVTRLPPWEESSPGTGRQ